jgi:hypothetical protein
VSVLVTVPIRVAVGVGRGNKQQQNPEHAHQHHQQHQQQQQEPGASDSSVGAGNHSASGQIGSYMHPHIHTTTVSFRHVTNSPHSYRQPLRGNRLKIVRVSIMTRDRDRSLHDHDQQQQVEEWAGKYVEYFELLMEGALPLCYPKFDLFGV